MSVEIAQRHGQGALLKNNGGIGYKKHSQQRDYNVRMGRISGDEKLNNSVHDFTVHKKQPSTGGGIDGLHELSLHHGGHHNHSRSLMKVDDLNLNDKKKEILDKKRYEQMHKNYNQQKTG